MHLAPHAASIATSSPPKAWCRLLPRQSGLRRDTQSTARGRSATVRRTRRAASTDSANNKQSASKVEAAVSSSRRNPIERGPREGHEGLDGGIEIRFALMLLSPGRIE